MDDHVGAFEAAVERLPSMYVFLTAKGNCVCLHGAIPPELAPFRNQILAACNTPTTQTVPLPADLVSLLEWTDFGTHDDVNEESRRRRVDRRHTDELLSLLGGALCIGGHQDRVESFAILDGPSTGDDYFWKPSPTYAETAPLLVARALCAEPDRCGLVAAPIAIRLRGAVEQPLIVKTSIAYTGKPSVTGTSFVSTRNLEWTPALRAPGDGCFALSAYIRPRRTPTDTSTTRKSLRADELFAFTIADWIAEVDRLPVLYTQDAVDAYFRDELRRIDRPTLLQLIKRFEAAQPNDADCVRVCRRNDADMTFIGDIHSNVHGLLDVLQSCVTNGILGEDMRLRPNNLLVFLGDYGHRGPYGMLVYACLMVLKVKNPGGVFLVRGNHERQSMWRNPHYVNNGLYTELLGMHAWRAELALVRLRRRGQ